MPGPRGRIWATVVTGVLGLALSGCGSGRVTAPDLSRTAAPNGFTALRYPADGVALAVPRAWTITPGQAPLVAVYSSGSATIALWRYPGGRPLAGSGAGLTSALTALLGAVRSRDPGLQVARTGLSSVSGAGAVILDAVEQVNGHSRRVRSEHIYGAGGEIVLDAYAPAAQFSAVDHAVFSPVRRSLTLLDGGRPAAGTVTTS